MLEFVNTSDWHCQKLKKLFPSNHLQLTLTEIRKPLAYAVKNGIKTVVHGGDMFDTPDANHKYIKGLISIFLEFKQLNIYVIIGNHDLEDAETNSMHLIKLCHELGILPHVKVFMEQTKMKIEGIPFNFMPFPCQDFIENRINIAHLETAGVRRDNNTVAKSGVEAISDGINFIGHIHKQQVVGTNTYFCGGLFQTTFGETNPKGWYHVQIKKTTSGRLKEIVKFVANNCDFELINLKIEVTEDFTKIVKDSMKLYKLHVSDGIVVPPKLTLKYPNIIDIVGCTKHGEELSLYSKDLPPDMYDGSNVLDELVSDPLWGLLEFLRTEGLKKNERKRGIQIIEDLLRGIDNGN